MSKKSMVIDIAMTLILKDNTRKQKPAHQVVLAGKTLPPARAF